MGADDLTAHAQHTMTVCNSCRYCEQYCPVFPAIENRSTFAKHDLMYLANLCHNCGECLYACQYAPPHPFAISVPRTMAELRLASYETYCWPGPLAALFRRNGALAGSLLSAAFGAILLGAAWAWHGNRLWSGERGADFYAVVPHSVLTGLFGGVAAFITLALAIGVRRFWTDIAAGEHRQRLPFQKLLRALRDAFTLRHLHSSGVHCTSAEEERTPWRRRFHHATFYGFALCFASTSVAALYHSAFGWEAPYGYTSLPVVLGTIGGIGLVVGPIGLFVMRRRRDRALGDPAQEAMDVSFITLLLLTSVTGLLLLAVRESPLMSVMLMVHLGTVLALFVTLPYGKFVHGLYRVAALIKYAGEDEGPVTGSVEHACAPPVAATPYLVPPLGVRSEQPTK